MFEVVEEVKEMEDRSVDESEPVVERSSRWVEVEHVLYQMLPRSWSGEFSKSFERIEGLL